MDDQQELDWNEYSLLIDLYKFYMNLALQASVFCYGITGGVLAFYFSNCNLQYTKAALILCLIFNILFALISDKGIKLINPVESRINQLVKILKLGIYPSIYPLKFFLRGSSIAYLLVALVLIILFCLNRTDLGC